jgi:DNA polymerase I
VFEAAEFTNGTYDELMEELFNISKDHRMEVEIESYATACFFLYDFDADDGSGVKKRYSQLIEWDEDDGVIENPTPKTKGFELVRSDSAPITAEAQEKVLHMILEKEDAKNAVFEYLEELVNRLENGEIPIEEAAIPKAIASKPPKDYGTENRRPMPHIRGAKYATKHIDGENIEQGSKPLKVPIRKIAGNDYPHHYSADTAEDGDEVDYIAVEDVDNIPNEFKIDWELLAEKVIRNPIEDIIKTMGWSWVDIVSSGRQSGLDQF